MKNLLKMSLIIITVAISVTSCLSDSRDDPSQSPDQYAYFNYTTGRYYAAKDYYKNGGYWGNDGYYYRDEFNYYYENNVPYYFEDNDVAKIKIFVEKHWGDSRYPIGIQYFP